MSILIKEMKMPKNCGECPMMHSGTFMGNKYPCVCHAAGFLIKPSETDLRDGLCPLVEVKDLAGKGMVSDLCLECRHCVSEEITDGLWGYDCEEEMENFYNGNEEGCYQFWRKEED